LHPPALPFFNLHTHSIGCTELFSWILYFYLSSCIFSFSTLLCHYVPFPFAHSSQYHTTIVARHYCAIVNVEEDERENAIKEEEERERIKKKKSF